MSYDDTWFAIGNRIVPSWQRLVLDNIGYPPVKTQGSERINYFVRLITDAMHNPIALEVKVESPDLGISYLPRLVFSNKPVKMRITFEELP